MHAPGSTGCVAITVMHIVAGRSNGELGHVEAAEIDCAGTFQSGQCARRSIGDEIGTDFRAAGSDLACSVIHILVCEWNTSKRSDSFAIVDTPVYFPRGVQSLFRFEAYEGVQYRLQLFSATNCCLRNLDSGYLAGADTMRHAAKVKTGDLVAHGLSFEIASSSRAASKSDGSISN